MDNFLLEVGSLSETNKHKLQNFLQVKKKHRLKSIELERYLHLLSKCRARTSNGKECSRRCLNVISNYCHCHIDNPEKYQNVKPKRNSTKTINIDWDQINHNDYAKCRLIHLNGSYYLVDENGVLFDRKDYTIIGQQIDEKINWF